MRTNEVSQTIHLVDEHYHPDEAWKMLNELISEHFYQHNIRMMRKWESSHGFDSRPFDIKINQMKKQSLEAKMLLEEAKSLGFHVEIKANIEVRMLRKPLKDAAATNISQN